MSETDFAGNATGSLAPGFEQPANPWSERQISTRNALVKTSSMCSIVGSLLIIFMILNRRKSSTVRTYNRLLFSISVVDIFGSCAFFVGSAAIPADMPLAGTNGNTTTCNVQGFFLLWCTCCTHWYNTALMFYFTLTIVYEMKEDTFATRIEPFLHIFAIFFPFGCAVTTLLLDSYNASLGGWGVCFIESFPPGCTNDDSVPCTQGEHANILFMAFVMVPGFFLMAVIYVSIFLIYQAVKRRERLSQQATFRGSTRRLELSSTSSMIMLRSARTKAYMFATIFFVTYALTLIVESLVMSGKFNVDNIEKYIPLFQLVSFLIPFQGFLNFVVYIHPRFTRIRRMRKDKSFFWVLWKAITLTTIVAHPAKSSKPERLAGSTQTEKADHMLSSNVSSQNDKKIQDEGAIDNAETSLKEAENQNDIERHN